MGSTLTLDGDCEACWDGGKSVFKQTVKSVREQLKQEMRDAPGQELFFGAYSKAKAAGVSESVLKKLCEEHWTNTRKRSRVADGLEMEGKGKSSRASLVFPRPSSAGIPAEISKVTVIVGLSGAEVLIDVDGNLSLEDLRNRVRQGYPEAGERFIKFSSGGVVVNTAEALFEYAQDGETICAAFLKNVDAMQLHELQDELSLGDREFQGHLHTLRQFQATRTPADVARYLWDNQVLLTAMQAQRIFDALVKQIARAQKPSSLGRDGPRAQLVLALHSFCSEPYAIWEPVDDCDECLWANMRWGDDGLESTQLGKGRYHLRGQLSNISSASSSSSVPGTRRKDVSKLAAVLTAQRENAPKPLSAMTFLEAYHYTWQTLA